MNEEMSRFLDRISHIDRGTSCWVWSSRDTRDRGRFRFRRRRRLAHRASWEIFCGACDNNGWRGMESATKTEPVLAVVDGDVRTIRYGKTSHVPLYGWCIADMGPEDCDLCEPTHWQPLPLPPKEA